MADRAEQANKYMEEKMFFTPRMFKVINQLAPEVGERFADFYASVWADGNQFSGGANYFWQTDALTDSNVTREGVSISTGLTEEFGFHRDEYRDFTANLGGPISEDRVWFFTSVQTRRASATPPGIDPSITDIARVGDQSSVNDRVDFKLTARLSDTHQLDALMHHEQWRCCEKNRP